MLPCPSGVLKPKRDFDTIDLLPFTAFAEIFVVVAAWEPKKHTPQTALNLNITVYFMTTRPDFEIVL